MSYENWEIQGLRERLAVKTNEGETLKAKVRDLEAEIDRMNDTIKTLMNVKKEFKPTIDPAMKEILAPIVRTLRLLYWDRNAPPHKEVMDDLNELQKRCAS